MCGIAGYYSPDHAFSETDLYAMTNAIAHRGPDAVGFYSNSNIGLGHHRLSIIDPSTNANQPMHSANQRYVMVYNGEIYNYQEIATELKHDYKINFRTSSDSEVILEAYIKYGLDFFQKLNGMFAIAIYDLEKDELFLCRDRIGIKPLYYFWDGKNFAFASELKALKKVSAIPLTLNHSAIYDFLHLGFIPAPQSIYKSIKKLEPGTWVRISKNSFQTGKYWTIHQQIKEKVVIREKEAIVKLSELLMSSVQYRIKSNESFGVFLSGGIDSSLIAANATNLAGVKVNTFSIGFEENMHNESVYAKTVANHLGTNHNEFIVSNKEAITLIDTIFDTFSEPFADSSSIPTLLVSKLAKQHVPVVLSGEGGDELFLGYGAYKWAKRLNHPLTKILHNPIKYILLKSCFERHAKYFEYQNKNQQYSHIFSQEQYYFSLSELNLLITEDLKHLSDSINREYLNNFGIEINHLNRKLISIEKQSIFDLHFYLPNDLLTKVDRASMHYSLEARVPYLDHRIIEFALNLSPHLKYRNGISKYILKEILYTYLPKKLFNRPKQGFSIPLKKWLRNELCFMIEETLSKNIIEKFGYVRFEYVEQLKKAYYNGKDYYYSRIWLLIILHKWLQRNTL